MSRQRFSILLVGALALGAVFVVPGLATAHHHGTHHHLKRDRDFRRDRAERRSGTTSEEPSGTIASFQNGVLTINLNGGGTVTGQVNGDTEIQCETPENGTQGTETSGTSQDQPVTQEQSQSGENESQNNDNESGEERTCTSADLTPGTVVKKAELNQENGMEVFEEIELAK